MPSNVWRPHATIRTKVIGIVWRGRELLVSAVRNDQGVVTGWRPLGGSIEFGERAETALAREFREEIDQDLRIGRLLAVLENIYTHEGAAGHEVVFVYDVSFAKQDGYARDAMRFIDGGIDSIAQWMPIDAFRSGAETLFPIGLLDVIEDR